LFLYKFTNIRVTNKTLPFNGFAHRDDRTNGDGLQDFCILFRASATLLNLPDEPEGLNQAIAIELVGSRFLRRMVRIIVV
jgi:predicted glycosyltransferase involved in capsule biosynthesis